MTTMEKVDRWPGYKNRWTFNGTSEEAAIFSGANVGYESRMQHDFMLSRGLKPEHSFLDYGCGALRGTIRLVDYLDDGNFCGSDISVGLLKEAILECQRLKLQHLPILQLMDSFDATFLCREFDYVLCNSVTVHIHPSDIEDLFIGIGSVLKPEGKAYVSIHPLDEKEQQDYRWDGYRWWYKTSYLITMARKSGLNLSNIPGKIANRVPGQRHPVIPFVNTNMTEWMMEGTL
jgi:SAM-dependent methyltransferase